MVAATADRVVRCDASQIAAAATDHSALGSDETRSDQRLDEISDKNVPSRRHRMRGNAISCVNLALMN